MVMLDAPELNVIPAPGTSDTLDEVPFKLKLVAAGTAGPIIVTELILVPVVCESVILLPAHRIREPEVIAPLAPAVAPPPEAEIWAAD